MKKSEIVKKYTELCGKRPTLKINNDLTADEKFKIKQETKINQYIWTLKKEIFTEYIEKSQDSDDNKIKLAKSLIDKFVLNDLLKIYHGYRYTINIKDNSYTLFHD